MYDTTVPDGRRRKRALRVAGMGAAAAALVAGMLMAVIPSASAATLFSADFNSGVSGWSKSGGNWVAATDGTGVYQQNNASSDLARVFNGDNSWTDYSLQARVKPLSFSSSDGFAGIGARSSGATTYYRVVLLSGQVQLQAVKGGTVTVLGTRSQTVSTGTWYTLRVDVSGTTIAGYVNGTLIASAGSTVEDAGRISLQTFHATANFDDVSVVTVGSTPPPTSAPATTGGTTTRPPTSAPPTTGGPTVPAQTGLVGWATQGGGTTGGSTSTVVNVSSLSALTSAASSSTSQTIRISGNFSCSADVRVASNKTILGVGSGSGLNGCGFNMSDVNNVIIRNVRVSNVLAGNGNGDAIHIDHGTHIWIDHSDLSSNTSSGTDTYDGLLDCTHACDYVTVSWNILHDHIKCSLVGHSDSNSSEDTGHLRITYHHNLFRNCAQRGPRTRFGNPIHVYNNYYVNTVSFDYSYSIATTEGAGVLVESNYFEGITDPIHLSEGSSDGGNLVARNNTLVNSGPILQSGSVASIPYSYTADASANVKSIVTAGAGTGKIST
jgi:pectate lyase